jgi:hypothetical protein
VVSSTLAEFCAGVIHWSNQLALIPDLRTSIWYLEMVLVAVATLLASASLSKVLRSVLICRLTFFCCDRNSGTDKSAPQVKAVPLACKDAKLPTSL